MAAAAAARMHGDYLGTTKRCTIGASKMDGLIWPLRRGANEKWLRFRMNGWGPRVGRATCSSVCKMTDTCFLSASFIYGNQ